MFGFLKDKLKSWVQKAAPEEQKEELNIAPQDEEKFKPPKEEEAIEKPKKGKKEKPKKTREKAKEKKTRGKKGKKKEVKEEEIEMPEEEKLEEKEEEKPESLEELKEIPPEKINEMPKNEQEEELQKTLEAPIEKKGGFSKIKSFFGFGQKQREGEALGKREVALSIEEERKISSQIWSDIAQEKEKFEEEKEVREKKSIMSFFKTSFSQEKFDELWPELEMGLLQSNIAYKVVDEIKKQLQEKMVNQKVSEKDLHGIFKKIIEELLLEPPNLIEQIKEKLKQKKPIVIIFVGINGSGKTTTMAKLAHLLKKENISVCMAAADTFRSAAIEQLQTHSENLNVPFIKKEYGSDPASVGFDAIAYAKKHALDVVLIDTAGRMQTKDSLMKEMEKIVRVCTPDMKIFVGESVTGNDATEQAAAFNDAINLDGIILSKADVDEKGGTAISVSYITKKPIFFLGTGQTYDSLEVFSKEKVLKSLGL